ncbi:MAG: ABC transporter permease [Christensenellaceae bacterium]|nr:ABC transporter permease [Christensenellaceae bacterium]
MQNIRKKFKYLINEFTVIPITLVLIIFAAIFVPHFFSATNLRNILGQLSDVLIISAGMMLVVLNGGIDFSMASVMGLGSVIGAMVMNQTDGLLAGSPWATPVGILIMVAIGTCIGVINGCAVAYLKMPSFMATMATQLVVRGLTLYIVDSKAIGNLPSAFLFIGNGKFGFLPFSIILSIVVLAIIWILLNKSVYGKQIYAIGTNHKAAKISGIPIKKRVFSLFVLCGTLAGIGGLISTSRLGAAMPDLNQDRLMDFVTAVIIGGTSVFGGKGKLICTIIGGLFIVILNNTLGLLGLTWFTILMIKGIFLMGILIFEAYTRSRSTK